MEWREFHVGWGNLDSNGHMRNTAYLDLAVDARMMFFRDHGFPSSEFSRLQFGPVVKKDEIEFFHELRLLDRVRVSFELAGMNEEGSRFRLRNRFMNDADQVCAQVTTTGGWLDLTVRKLKSPPEGLLAAMQLVPRTADFEDIVSKRG